MRALELQREREERALFVRPPCELHADRHARDGPAERELEARQKARLERCVDGARLTPTTDDDGENT